MGQHKVCVEADSSWQHRARGLLSRYDAELARGAIVTTDVRRVRIRPADADLE